MLHYRRARQGPILNSHRVIGIATDTSMVLNCALVTYIMITADVGLPDAVERHTPGETHYIPKQIKTGHLASNITGVLMTYFQCLSIE